MGNITVRGFCGITKGTFQSSCPPLAGYQGFFYCSVIGRDIPMAARRENFGPSTIFAVSTEEKTVQYKTQFANDNF